MTADRTKRKSQRPQEKVCVEVIPGLLCIIGNRFSLRVTPAKEIIDVIPDAGIFLVNSLAKERTEATSLPPTKKGKLTSRLDGVPSFACHWAGPVTGCRGEGGGHRVSGRALGVLPRSLSGSLAWCGLGASGRVWVVHRQDCGGWSILTR